MRIERNKFIKFLRAQLCIILALCLFLEPMTVAAGANYVMTSAPSYTTASACYCGNNLTYNEITPATCTTARTVKVRCTSCKRVRSSHTEGSALTHDWGYLFLSATCTRRACMYFECSRCGETKDLTYFTPAPLGHDFKTYTSSATCTSGGYTYQKCDRTGCDEVTSKTYTSSALGHEWEWVTVDPNCTDMGYMYKKCIRCRSTKDKTFTEPALGHNSTEYIVEPTCTEQGYTLNYCLRCEEELGRTDYTDALGHGETVSKTIAPTCTEKGFMASCCSRCGEIFEKSDYTDELGHEYAEHIFDGNCCEEGYTCLACSRCGDETDIVYSGLGDHVMEKITVSGTCTTQSYSYEICTVCSYSTDAVYGAYGSHNGSNGVCSNCGAKISTSNTSGKKKETVSDKPAAPTPKPPIDISSISASLNKNAQKALGGSGNTTSGLEPISFNTGNFYLKAEDYTYETSVTTPFSINRTYNALSTIEDGPFGAGWTSEISQTVTETDIGTIEYRRADGSLITFERQSFNVWDGDDAENTKLRAGLLGYTVEQMDGTKYIFDFSGRIQKIKYSSNDRVQIERNADGTLTGMTLCGSEHFAVECDENGHITKITQSP